MYSPTRDDLQKLTGEDLQDVFDIIDTATRYVNLPDMRNAVARSLRKAFQANGVAFFLSDNSHRTIDNYNLVGSGIDTHYLKQYAEYYCRYDPFQHKTLFRQSVCKVDDIMPYSNWVKLKIYNEFYIEQNIHHKLSIYLRSSDKVLGLIGLFRPREDENFSDKEMTKARILVRYLTTALDKASQFNEIDKEKAIYSGCVNISTSLGIIILGSDLRPIYQNSIAKDYCNNLNNQSSDNNNSYQNIDIFLPEEIINDCKTLSRIYKSNNQNNQLSKQRVIDAGKSNKFHVVTSLVEYSRNELPYYGFFIYLYNHFDNIKNKMEYLKDVFQLTNKEAEIASYVCQGLTNTEISEKLCISRFTVETHLKNIFIKTNIKHRAGLASILQYN